MPANLLWIQRVAAGWLAVAACGCGESAEPTAPTDAESSADFAGVDAGADGGMAGRPCAEDRECAGICVNDGAGLRCAAACGDGLPECGDTQVCRAVGGRSACLAPTSPEGGDGSPCAAGEPCGPGLACADLGSEGVRCAPRCDADSTCSADPLDGAERRCGTTEVDPRVCVRSDSPMFSCLFEGCARGDLLCLAPETADAFVCVETCEAPGEVCGGGLCARLPADGTLYCAPMARQEAGGGCASGGAAACMAGLTCSERWPGDARAQCVQACDDAVGCGAGFACRRPAGATATFCLPVPFGPGDGQGVAGTDCGGHGPTDCLPELDCVAGVDGPVCARACDASGGCADGARCLERRVDGPYCLLGAGTLGGACNADVACAEGVCAAPAEAGGDPDARRCAVACEGPEDCPEGSTCSGRICRARVAGMAPLGDDCGEALPACASGLCVADPQDGRPRCTRDCAEVDCPAALTCQPVDARRFCF